ncbi:MAG: ThuA domain-containing protein [Planctomycetota bacterium]|jgi:type 1 glutamine amidotransferase
MKKNKMTDWFICFVVVLGTCAFAVSEQEVKLMGNAMPDKPVVQPAKERTMLVFSLCRGFKHSSVPYWARALDIMSEKTGAFKVVHSDDMSVFTPQSLERFDVICLNNTTKLTPDEAQQKAILDFIKGGRGIVGIHAATDNFYEWPEGMQMMGGKFTGHPWTSRGTWAVKLDEPEHPLMKPFQGKNFKIKDEIYRTEAPLYSRDNQRVLMSLDMSDPVTKNAKGVRPDDMDTGITWIKPVGQGRLFYCSLGHVHAVTWNSAVLEHFLAGIQYAMGDYKVEDRPLGEPPAKLERAALNALLGELKTYDWDKSRASLVKLEDLIKEHYLNPVTLKQIELKLVQTLDTDMPAAAKDFVCRQLAVIGSEASVEALLKMLNDPKTANLGRYALEKIPSPAVDQGVLKKLNTVSDSDTKIGMITTLGVRKCDSAVDKLAKATGDNPATAAAAIQALGTIGTLKAAEQLQKMDADEGVEDALLSCAESLFEQGKTGAAQRLYSQLYASGTSSGIRAAGLTGLVRSGGDSAMLLKAVNSEDTMVQKAAMMQIATIQDVSLLKTLASEMKSLSDTAKIQMMTAFAANETKAGRAEIERVLLAEPQNRDVRFAAYQALSELGDGSTAVWLAGYAAQAPDREEKKMAQEALYRLPGEEVDEAILAKITFNCSSAVEEPVMLELIRSTAQRPIPSACPVLLKTARRADGEIASESIRALQSLATAEYIDDVVDLLIEKPGTATENVVVAAAEKIEDRNSRAKTILADRLPMKRPKYRCCV